MERIKKLLGQTLELLRYKGEIEKSQAQNIHSMMTVTSFQ